MLRRVGKGNLEGFTPSAMSNLVIVKIILSEKHNKALAWPDLRGRSFLQPMSLSLSLIHTSELHLLFRPDPHMVPKGAPLTSPQEGGGGRWVEYYALLIGGSLRMGITRPLD